MASRGIIKNITIDGATGDIGGRTASMVNRGGPVNVIGISCGSNIDRCEELIRRHEPRLVGVHNEEKAEELRHRFRNNTKTKVLSGPDGVLEACVRQEDTDLVVIASVGLNSFATTLEAVKLGRNIAPSSKEPFVFGSEVILPIAQKNDVVVHPIDSELSAIWQIIATYNMSKAVSNGATCVVGIDTRAVRRIWLGCSGGPFYGKTWEQMKHVTPDQIRHPTWPTMGLLVTTNSATLRNKVQELGETSAMFDIELERIGIMIDRTSNTHAMVEFKDGARLAHVSKPSMDDPIRFAIYGERERGWVVPAGHFKVVEPDTESFKLEGGIKRALRIGGTMPAVVIAANDAAVEAFHKNAIGFTEIMDLTEAVMSVHHPLPATESSIRDAYNWGRRMMNTIIGRL